MGIRSNKPNGTRLEQPPRKAQRLSSEKPNQGPRRHLEVSSQSNIANDLFNMPPGPEQALWVSNYREVPGFNERAEVSVKPRQPHIGRGLEKNISALGKCRNFPTLEACLDITRNPNFRPSMKGERNCRARKLTLKCRHRDPYRLRGVVIHSGHHVRCTDRVSNAFLNGKAGEFQGVSQRAWPVINLGK